MERAQQSTRSIAVALVLMLAPGWPAIGQQTAPRAADVAELRPEVILARALRANPVTAPYPINVTWNKGTVILSGRVGTKQIHDTAVQTAIAFGFRFRDDLVIDTAETLRAAMTARPPGPGYGPGYGGGGGHGPVSPNVTNPYYVYPEPLFGWMDDPFFGMQPPVVSFAPWWHSRLPMPSPASAPNRAAMRRPMPMPMSPQATAGAPGGAVAELPPVKGALELTVDANGQVFLRGVVDSEESAREIVQTAWSVPGVSRVFNQLQVKPRHAGVPAEVTPPPTPEPADAPPERTPVPPDPEPVDAPKPRKKPEKSVLVQENHAPEPAPQPHAIAALDGHRLSRRVGDALRRRPAVAALPIQVRTSGDAILLSGKVPSAYEAMLVYRAAQQTPGVHEVVDRLEFAIPDEDHPNPLVGKARPQDLEPYLRAQMSRNLGDLAHIDSVRVHGDHLEIRGTLLDDKDRDRILAILRSIPVLHGFQLDATLNTD